jgi:biotin transport system substrate-specific component
MDCVIKKESAAARACVKVAAVFAFAFLMCLGAAIRIPLPFSPVPLTGQTFFVLLSGAMLGGSLGAVSQLTYILFGLAGYSIFAASGSGVLYLAGPTGGYIFGFVLAALFCGSLIRPQAPAGRVLAVFLAAEMLILLCGVCWLKLVTGQPLDRLLLIGAAPFVPGDCIKALCACGVYKAYSHLTPRA